MFRALRGSFLIICVVACVVLPAQSQEIRGIVRDVTGQGLSNILVEANVFDSGSYTQLVTTTDQVGRYSLPFSQGSWSIAPDSSALNAIGCLSAGSTRVDVTNSSMFIPFTTRQLDLRRHVRGIVRDQFGQPVSDLQLKASIEENYQSYETNFTTGSDGRFAFAASAAIWRLRPTVGLSSNLFPEISISVEPHDSEKEIAIIAPRTTTSITGTLTNFSNLELRAECVAFGHRYVRSMWIFEDNYTFDLPVFPDTWTLAVTNSPGWVTRYSPSAPVTVEVSNASVHVNLVAVQTPSPVTRTLHLNFITASGLPLTNTASSVSASRNNGRISLPRPPLPMPPGGNPPAPGIRLQLEDGPWRIHAHTTLPGMSNSWSVTVPIVISSNGPTNLTVVFPDADASPRLLGHVHDTEGQPLANQWISINGTVNETNHSVQCVTDENGNFSVPALPGQWVSTLLDISQCQARTTTTVASTNQTIELVSCSRPQTERSPVTMAITNDFADPDIPYRISQSGVGTYYGTNGQTGSEIVLPLSTGLSTISLSPEFGRSFGGDTAYELVPLRKHLQASLLPTNFLLRVRTGTARIEGRLRDPFGKIVEVGSATARTTIEGVSYTVSGPIRSGYFSLNVVPGDWQIAASASGYAPLDGNSPTTIVFVVGASSGTLPQYTEPPRQFIRVTNGVNLCEFVVEELPAPVPLTVSVISEDGLALTNLNVRVSVASWQSTVQSVNENQHHFEVRPGSVLIYVSATSSQSATSDTFLFPSLNATISPNSSNHIVLVAKSATKCLTASVASPSLGAVPVPVEARIEIDGTNYMSSACPASCSSACLPVFPGRWRVGVRDAAANELSFESSSIQEIVVSNLGEQAPVHFVLDPIGEDFRQTTFSGPTRLPDGRLMATLATQASLVWQIDASDDFEHWTPLFTVTSTNRSAAAPLPASSNAKSRFYRATWVY